MKQTHLIMIDPQNDFCTQKGPGGEKASLYVPGAEEDMGRLAKFITKNKKRLDDIHCTLDSHQSVHIGHPIFWVDANGNHPKPFTVITDTDTKNDIFTTYNPKLKSYGIFYTGELAKHGRYQLMIWPPHCRIGTWGHSLVPAIANALVDWEESPYAQVDFIAKGSNMLTEHYSGVQADVPDDKDPTTKLNMTLIDMLANDDVGEILITGEALSHCVANTIRDIAKAFGDENIKKFTLLTDTSSNVGTCEKMGEDFVKEMVGRGMKTTTTKDW